MEYYRSTGKAVMLENCIGKGGEGAVYGTNQPGLAAKIYNKPPDNTKAEKLSAMIKVKNDRLLSISAWPVDTLHALPNSPVAGILMHRISGFKEIHKLYSPKSRIAEFPNAGWDFLIHSAANLARAVSVVHSQNHVIGDINHGNIVVSNSGIAMLIDCDSFQLQYGGRRFACNVGVPIYQPPEMQDIKSFIGVDRERNHDAFGLAVLIFQLLFMGRHPFAERYSGKGDMPLHRAIKEKRFAYSRASVYKRPSGTLSFDEIPDFLAELFERAFLTTNRPTAENWIMELERLLRQLKQCPSNPSHRFCSRLSKCPWCRIESITGIVLFSPAAGDKGGVDIERVWRSIEEVPIPKRPGLPDWMSMGMRPSPQYNNYRIKKRIIKITSAVTLALGLMCFSVFSMAGLGLGGICICAVAAAAGFKPAPRGVMEKTKKKYDSALEKFNTCIKPWKNDDMEQRLLNKRSELMKLYQSYRDIEAAREGKIRDMQQNRRKYQLEMFLSKYSISDINFKGLAPDMKGILKSRGIITAADVGSDIISMPDIKPGTGEMLIKWRRSLESRFVFDPGRSIDCDIIKKIDREFLCERNRIYSALSAGLDDMKGLYQTTVNTRKDMFEEIEKCAKELSIARANLKALGYKM